ncbi:MAG: alcohol dehydrogenase [Aeromicrobium sp.]|jgi:NDMA-dependent alcohol dehydrogenase|nr:alcohol dehydrogenase [Aeromicrobium sp.]
MKARGAVIHGIGEKWSVEDMELDEPKEGEVLIKVMATGLCHSDEHLRTGDLGQPLPLVGGHEGAGIVEAVGPNVTRVKVGDHVSTYYLPACGTCRWCASGMQFICDNGKDMFEGMMLDGTPRFHLSDGRGIGAMQRLGTFSNWLVAPEMECQKIDDDIPFEYACLMSCGLPTGWGSAVNAGGVQPGDVSIIMGAGGVGSGAVQGAAQAGARVVIAVDPVEFKRAKALESFGATHAFATIEEAMPFVHEQTNGQGADQTIMTMGRMELDDMQKAFDSVRKMGTVVVTTIGVNEGPIPINPLDLTIFCKQLRGAIFGLSNPTKDIPRLLADYKAGRLNLQDMVTTTYSIDDINLAYDDMYAGKNIRGVILHEH